MSVSPPPPTSAAAPAAETRVVRPGELSSAETDAWTRLHRTVPELASPYFHPAFTRLVAEARATGGRDDVRVGVTADGFFPFQRSWGGRATPPGGRLCDYHGVIAAPGAVRDAAKLLRGCGLRSYAFHMLPPGQATLATTACDELDDRAGVRVNLEGGYDAFVARREAAGSKRHRKIAQFRRRMERERGEVTFTWHDSDPEAWALLIDWKRARYAATGFCDVLAAPWVRNLLTRCRDAGCTPVESPEDAADAGFSGVFCTLRAGGEVVAAHLLLRSGARLHAWFPAYDLDARQLSPGNVLMTELLKAAAERGVTAVDLGAGDEPYKADYATDRFPLRRGVAETPGAAATLAAVGRRVRDSLKAHPAGAPARLAAAWVRPLRERLSLR